MLFNNFIIIKMDAVVCMFSSLITDIFIYLQKKKIESSKNQETEEINFDQEIAIDTDVMYEHKFYYIANKKLELALEIFKSIPVHDTNIRKDTNKLIRKFHCKYQNLLNYTDILAGNDSEEILNFPTDSDRLIDIVTQGPGVLLLERNKGKNSDLWPFKIDLNEMTKYEVRDGFIKYGGCLYIDNDENMEIEYMGKYYDRLSSDWNWAKFIFKSSLIVCSVIKYHAAQYHTIYGSLIPAAILKLSPCNQIRKMMLPFIYNTLVGAESARTVLFGKGKYFDRLFAFTDIGLNDFMKDIYKNFTHVGFVEKYKTLGPTIKKYAYFEDTSDLYNIYIKFLTEYIQNNVTESEILEFCDSIEKFNIDPKDIISFIADFMIIVTVNHELVGNSILKWIYDPSEICTKLRNSHKLEDLYSDKQTYYQQLTIALVTTMNKLPKLMDDISHYYSGIDANSPPLNIYNNFRSELVSLSQLIDQRNNDRKTPFYGSHPKYLELTISQ
jgi:hypothetical protein